VSGPCACLASIPRGLRTKHKFGKDAPHRPHINARAVLLTTKEKLRSSVPPEQTMSRTAFTSAQRTSGQLPRHIVRTALQLDG
jgi:hypothetical protein